MSKRIFLTKLHEFTDKDRAVFDVEGTPVLVIRAESGFFALANRCPHLGFPLKGGKVENGIITCPLHNSQFDLRTGENIDWVRGVAGVKLPEWSRRVLAMGKKPSPLHTFPIVAEGDDLYVEI
jgi:nitrite reductase/ring-hydroxylating ferredoxin subunit